MIAVERAELEPCADCRTPSACRFHAECLSRILAKSRPVEGDVEWAKQLASEIEERCVQVDYDYLGFDEDLCVKLLIAALRAQAKDSK